MYFQSGMRKLNKTKDEFRTHSPTTRQTLQDVQIEVLRPLKTAAKYCQQHCIYASNIT